MIRGRGLSKNIYKCSSVQLNIHQSGIVLRQCDRWKKLIVPRHAFTNLCHHDYEQANIRKTGRYISHTS